MGSLKTAVERIFELKDERIAELEEALRWYGDEDNYRTFITGSDEMPYPTTYVSADKGERARKVLYVDD